MYSLRSVRVLQARWPINRALAVSIDCIVAPTKRNLLEELNATALATAHASCKCALNCSVQCCVNFCECMLCYCANSGVLFFSVFAWICINVHWTQCVPSVLWHCWLGHLTRRNPSPCNMTYNVFGGTLSLTQSINHWTQRNGACGCLVLLLLVISLYMYTRMYVRANSSIFHRMCDGTRHFGSRSRVNPRFALQGAISLQLTTIAQRV